MEKKLKFEVESELNETEILEKCDIFGLEFDVCRLGDNYEIEYNVNILENEEIWEIINKCRKIFNIVELKMKL